MFDPIKTYCIISSMNLQGGNRFFFEFSGEEGFLSEEESFHLVKVLRKHQGDKILLINGKGKEFEAKYKEIIKNGKSFKVKVKILRLTREEKQRAPKIIGILPILKGDKTEWLVEKSTELGVEVFVPFYSTFSVAKPSKNLIPRLINKAKQALKQSGRLFMPEILSPVELNTFLKDFPWRDSLKLVGGLGSSLNIENLKTEIKKAHTIVFITGPEGGFEKTEEDMLNEIGFLRICLSPYILRAETAFLALASIIGFLTLSLGLKG
ncbi:16S rRNA (uracil(1498)-N(3))-methyltransferase [Thermodesulfobacterium sp. TA1]|uniref:RsmE family RNA methyltransferase n=1 Tax=Thermodesulfobacterium sp. TA1 TaxID=2234087 RepID=UPI00143D4227|nr:RsmE family RNA methyltransferase [Thermodesulfobacterium sp. TA1]